MSVRIGPRGSMESSPAMPVIRPGLRRWLPGQWIWAKPRWMQKQEEEEWWGSVSLVMTPLTTPFPPAPAGYPYLVLTLSCSGSKQIVSKTDPWSQNPVSPKRVKKTGLAAAPRDTPGGIVMCARSSGCRVRGAQGHPGQQAAAAVTVPDSNVFLTEPCTGFCGDAPLPNPCSCIPHG